MEQNQQTPAIQGDDENQSFSQELQNEHETQAPTFENEAREQNAELDAILQAATATQECERDQLNEHNSKSEIPEQYKLAPEQASELAVKGIIEVFSFAQEQFNVDFKISQRQLGFLSVLFVPSIMKYGPVVQQYLEDTVSNIDDDSLMPEYCAGAGALAIGGLMVWQHKKAKKIPNKSTTEKPSAIDGD